MQLLYVLKLCKARFQMYLSCAFYFIWKYTRTKFLVKVKDLLRKMILVLFPLRGIMLSTCFSTSKCFVGLIWFWNTVFECSLSFLLGLSLLVSTMPSRLRESPPRLDTLSPLSSGPGPAHPGSFIMEQERSPQACRPLSSPRNRLFVAPSKQVSDQQKSIKAWWAFLSQLGPGQWAALLAAPRALCVAAVRWHRSSQD